MKDIQSVKDYQSRIKRVLITEEEIESADKMGGPDVEVPVE